MIMRFLNRHFSKIAKMKTLLTILITTIINLLLFNRLTGKLNYVTGVIPYDQTGRQIFNEIFQKNDGSLYHYNHLNRMVFVGGMPRSGTTLMRIMLDAHQKIRCGPETRIIPKILQMWNTTASEHAAEKKKLEAAGMSHNMLTSTYANFIMEVVVRHGQPKEILCNKDPYSLKYMDGLGEMFPNAKFILMIRDGRAVAHSIIERKIKITGFNCTDYKDTLKAWSRTMEKMYSLCTSTLLSRRCLPVRYENLILHPEITINEITNFLEVDFEPDMLNHEKHLEDKNMEIADKEPSTEQIKKPIYLTALTEWVHREVDQKFVRELDDIAPMLRKLNYDARWPGPRNLKNYYGVPDASVLEKLREEKIPGWQNLRKKRIVSPTK